MIQKHESRNGMERFQRRSRALSASSRSVWTVTSWMPTRGQGIVHVVSGQDLQVVLDGMIDGLRVIGKCIKA